MLVYHVYYNINKLIIKVDLSNAFNLVSCQALLEECAVHFPELFPWVGWCYEVHPALWHPWTDKFGDRCPARGSSGSTSLFHSSAQFKLVLSLAQDKECVSLLFNRWFLDNGVLAGHSQAVTRAVTLIKSYSRDGSIIQWGCLSTSLSASCLDRVTCPLPS